MIKTSTGDPWTYTGQNLTAEYQIPSAKLAVKKQLLRVYDNFFIYLNDGIEYEIELYNPTTIEYLAKIKLDGKYISNAGIVLRPGERVWLERYLDENRKFKFSTYQVDDTQQNKKAIEKNGDVEIEFYKEVIPYKFTHTVWPSNYNYDYNYDNKNICYDNLGGTTLGGNTFSCNCNNTRSIETGRSEKGDFSNQEFESVNKTFESYYSYFVSYKILPISQKVYTSKEIQLGYCTYCGRGIKKGENYCPKCGNKN
jgi:hypothetical protein